MYTQRHIPVRYVNCYNTKNIKLAVEELSDIDIFYSVILPRKYRYGKTYSQIFIISYLLLQIHIHIHTYPK